MKLFYIPEGLGDYCIVDENEKLIHQYNQTFDNLFVMGKRTLRTLSSIPITRKNKDNVVNNLPHDVVVDYEKWFNENINDIDENIDEPETTIIPF